VGAGTRLGRRQRGDRGEVLGLGRRAVVDYPPDHGPDHRLHLELEPLRYAVAERRVGAVDPLVPGFRHSDDGILYDSLGRPIAPLDRLVPYERNPLVRGIVASRVGFEPTTKGLKVPCSATELPARAKA
jgi:hypothetical protein